MLGQEGVDVGDRFATAMIVLPMAGGVAALRFAVPRQHRRACGPRRRADGEQVAGVGVPGHQPQCLLLTAAADQDRRRGCWIGGGEQMVSASW